MERNGADVHPDVNDPVVPALILGEPGVPEDLLHGTVLRKGLGPKGTLVERTVPTRLDGMQYEHV